MPISYVILFIFSSFVLTECVEDAPSDYPAFREFLDQSRYFSGYGNPVTDLNGFHQWNFKSMLFGDEVFVLFSASRSTLMSMLQETTGARFVGSDGTTSRAVSKYHEVIEDVEVLIPEQDQDLQNFEFAYFVSVEPHEDILPGTRVVALQWSRDQSGKQDWIFARFWRNLGDPGDIDVLPIGPRSGDITKYSIRIKHDTASIHVNDECVLSKTIPWLAGLRFIRSAGVAFSELPLGTANATMYLKNIRWHSATNST